MPRQLMIPEQLQAVLDRHGWSAYRFAKLINTPVSTVQQWFTGTRIPPMLPLAICELERRHAYKHGLGTLSCPSCDGLAVEDDGLDDRYGCVLCGARVDPDTMEARP